MTMGILCIDDDKNFLIHLQLQLEEHFKIFPALGVREGMELLSKNNIDAVLLDIGLSDIDGIAGLKMIKEKYAEMPVVMLTAHREPKMVAESLKAGAVDYICKPFETEELVSTLKKIEEAVRLHERNDALLAEMNVGAEGREIIGKSPLVKQLIEKAAMLKGYNANVLIEGKSGTGKELFARYVHSIEENPIRPFIAINCAAIPDYLIESELFGHEKGAFTGAVAKKIGKFELAHGGDIFLDEISSLKIELQAKILRALQEKSFYRIGGNKQVHSDFRVIASTNFDLEEMIEKGTFRSDLFHRLRVVHLKIPSLAERKEDIPELARFFLKKYSRAGEVKTLDLGAMNILMEYDWSGNIRELENVMHSLIIMTRSDVILAKDMPEWLTSKLSTKSLYELNNGIFAADHESISGHLSLKDFLRRAERQFVKMTLLKHNGDRTKTAEALKLARSTFYLKLRELELA